MVSRSVQFGDSNIRQQLIMAHSSLEHASSWSSETSQRASYEVMTPLRHSSSMVYSNTSTNRPSLT